MRSSLGLEVYFLSYFSWLDCWAINLYTYLMLAQIYTGCRASSEIASSASASVRPTWLSVRTARPTNSAARAALGCPSISSSSSSATQRRTRGCACSQALGVRVEVRVGLRDRLRATARVGCACSQAWISHCRSECKAGSVVSARWATRPSAAPRVGSSSLYARKLARICATWSERAQARTRVRRSVKVRAGVSVQG